MSEPTFGSQPAAASVGTGEDGERKFPYGSITIETQKTTYYQADCERCGWHTRQADTKHWVVKMAEQHFAICPNPYYRAGAVAACGCWYYASPGDAVGQPLNCPIHGATEILKANVDEHVPWGSGTWTQDFHGGPK